MLKKVFCLFICFCVFLPFATLCVKAEGLSVSAKSAIIMNVSTGEIVFSKNPYEKRGIASTTKIMTALLAIEKADFNKVVAAKKGDVGVEGTSIYLKAGDKITVGALVKGMLLESGNDAANVTATAIAGNKEKFAELMNEKARELGMYSTNFVNPSGLTEEKHYSTAYDMALLSCAAIENDTFREICSARSFTVSYGLPEVQRTFYNHNKFLNRYDGALGIKTGFTKAAGRCLVTAAQRNGVTFVAVTLNAPDDWNDHIKMMDFAFENTGVHYAQCDLKNISVHVVGSEKDSIKVTLATPLEYHSVKETDDYKTEIYLPQFLYAGIKKGDCIGRVDLLNNKGKVISSSFITSLEDAPEILIDEREKQNFLEQIINKFKEGLS
ncbi:MAG: D-alanyl-D-alanine carboxypeptidase [Clostridia bacterium]|nr:D-alanyl-D-alanine carboxypeptidase [Clostridia bacterium]